MTPSRTRIGLTRSQSDDLIIQMAIDMPFVVAQWRHDEAIVYGLGKTRYEAVNMARMSNVPQDAEVCSRVVGENLVWRGPSGRTVTIEHMLELDD